MSGPKDCQCGRCRAQPLSLNEAQKQYASIWPDRDLGPVYHALALCGEAGEVAEPLRKSTYHGVPLDKHELMLELGDCLFNLSMLASQIGVSLEAVAVASIAKLRARAGS